MASIDTPLNPGLTGDGATGARGLDSELAQQRLKTHGPNELPRPPRRGPFRVLLGVLAEPMFLLLALAAAIYLALGELHEGLLLSAFAALTIGLVVFQEARSERALEALRALAAPTARVMRDGREVRIAARELVPGDLLLVGEGERVAADALLRRADGLSCDESLLTGESVPVAKRAARSSEPANRAPGGDDQPSLYAGALVVAGHGIAEVVATGSATETGKIGVSLAAIETAASPLQQSVARMVRGFFIVALVLCGLLFVLHGLIRGAWIEGALAAIALAMAMLPEEFPMAFAVFLALGAWRLAQVKVLARRPAVIETLGAASVLCVDKTGTLTENRMRLAVLQAGAEQLELDGREQQLPEAFHGLIEYALLASKRQAFDPMDLAVATLASDTLTLTEHLHADWTLERETGVSAALPAVMRVWRRPDGACIGAAKGAPEAIATMCALDAAARAALLWEVGELARRGLRMLAVAAGVPRLGDEPEVERVPSLRLLGLIGFQDPLRAGVRDSVAEARRAGIEVVMITGDHPETAAAIAREAGIALDGGVLTGAELAELDDSSLAVAVERTRVFARIRPQQKLRLVEAYRAAGEVVAMTGDGVNDAPALKAAHIGIAMGQRGTDVAREAAGLVLLDDDFSHLVRGVRLGRRVFDNLRKVMIYIAAIHLPIAGLAIVPLLAGMPPLLLPMHVVLVEMVIDPICSIAFENVPEEPDLMRRMPRRPDQPLIGTAQLWLALLQGALLLAGCLGLFLATLAAGVATAEARAAAFVALTAGNLMLVRVNAARGAALPRLFEPGHAAFWWVTILAGGVVAACVELPALGVLFGFARPSAFTVLLSLAVGAGSVLLFDLLKAVPAVQRVLVISTRARR